MPRQKPADKVALLAKQQEKLAAELSAARKEAAAADKAEAKRRHEIAGAAVLAELRDNPKGKAATALRDVLAARIKRPGERALFDLDAAPVAEAAE